MLKTKPLNALLSQSLSEHVSSAILFTPLGNLLATASNPSHSNSRQARVHAALAANIWINYDDIASKGYIDQSLPSSTSQSQPQKSELATPRPTAQGHPNKPSESRPPSVRSITIELSDNNLHIQSVTPAILLALIGPKQPTRQPSSNSSQHSNEGLDFDNSLPRGGSTKTAGSVLSVPSTVVGGGGGTLGVLKMSAQALVDYLKVELKDFESPDSI